MHLNMTINFHKEYSIFSISGIHSFPFIINIFDIDKYIIDWKKIVCEFDWYFERVLGIMHSSYKMKIW